MRKPILALVLVLGGCQTWGPTWSEVSGARYNVTILNRRPAVIETIDGNSAFATYPIKIEPGNHTLVVGGIAPGWRGPNLATLPLETAPCKRYFVNAQFNNAVQPDFVPVVDYVEDIAGCKINVAAK